MVKHNRMAPIKNLASQAQSINLYKNLITKVMKCCANIYLTDNEKRFVNNMGSHNVRTH